MADNLRWRHGETNPVQAAVDSGTVIEIGDLLWLATDDVRPASGQTDQAGEEANQAEFAINFAGVAMQASDSGKTDPITVATSGVFEFPCPSGTWEVGDLVGASENSGGDALEDQQVEAVTRPELALGIVVKREAAAVTKVKVKLLGRAFGDLQLSRLEKRQSVNTEALGAAKTLTCDDARIQVLDPGGAGRDVTLPDVSASKGLDFYVRNAADAAEVLTIKNAAAATICTPTQNETAYVFCDGAAWYGMVGFHN